MSSRQLTSVDSTSTSGFRDAHTRAIDLAADLDVESGLGHSIHRPESSFARSQSGDTTTDPCRRNPFPFRTRLNFTIPFKLPFFKSKTGNKPETQPTLPLKPFHSTTPSKGSRRNPALGDTQTHVWIDEEARLFNAPADTGDLGSPPSGTVRIDTTFTSEILRESVQRQQRHPDSCDM